MGIMRKVRKMVDEIQKNMNDFLKKMLSENIVDAVMVPRHLPVGEGVVQSLITDLSELDEALPLSLVMPVNSGTIISEYTKVAPSEQKVAAILKPCEFRAAVELAKLKQASFDNIILVGVDCPGTYSVNDYKEMIKEEKDPQENYLNNLQAGRDDEKLRSACRACEYSTPENMDITLGFYGSDLKTPVIIGNSDEGKAILEKLGVQPPQDIGKREEEIAKLNERRLSVWNSLIGSTKEEVEGLDNLLKFFESCINCHNCMDVCPVCYCRECFFDSPTFEYEAHRYLSWSKRKGIIKMPRDTLLFHLTRMNHMTTSCVGCGMCEQACPSKIELLKIYKTVGHFAQKVFDYVPGKSLDDELPLITFREQELEPR
jgi:formate dehydrogenase subunit beta